MRAPGGKNGLSGNELSKTLGIDPLQIEPLLDALIAIDWVGKLAEQGNSRYVLLCDPETVRAERLLSKLLLDPAPDLAAFWREARFADMRLADILQA